VLCQGKAGRLKAFSNGLLARCFTFNLQPIYLSSYHYFSLSPFGNSMTFSRNICFLLLVFSFLFCAQGFAEQSSETPLVAETLGVKNEEVVVSDIDVNKVVPVGEEVLVAKLSPGERKWYYRFQEGIPLFDGWKKITQAVIEKFPEHEREQQLATMQALGLKIGYEWSRDNHVRKVNTDMLRAWGKDLRKAGAESHVQLAQVIHKIDKELNALYH
jgi:hypothetical protein